MNWTIVEHIWQVAISIGALLAVLILTAATLVGIKSLIKDWRTM